MNSAAQEPTEIPADIERLYEGQWIAWDTVTREVVGHGATLDEAMSNSDAAFRAGHELYYHHVVPGDAVIVGGL
jgi:predicted RNase H-like HicB family nuclease